MKSLLLVIASFVSSVMFASGNLPTDPKEYAEWENKILKSIEAQAKMPRNIAVENLSRLVHALSTGMNTERGDRPVFHKAQSTLLAIPGHAKYFEEKVLAMRAEVLANAKRSTAELNDMLDREGGPVVADEWNYISYCQDTVFPMLGLMPSPETVGVLGRFLDNPEGRDGKTLLGSEMNEDVQDYPTRLSNAECAVRAIGKLRIVNPPAPPDDIRETVQPEEVDAWRDWYNEIKEGRRTFRFEGDPTEYDLDGPASAEKLARIKALRERETVREERRERNKAETPAFPTPSSGGKGEGRASSESRPPYAALLTSGGILLAALAWFFLRRGRKRLPKLQA